MNKMFALILVIALLFIGVVKPAYSLPAYEVYTIYFENDNFKTIVGEKIFGCSGNKSLEGRTSNYYKRVQSPCNGGSIITKCYALVDGISTLVPCSPYSPKP
jgi:hypothetical protein